MLQRLHSFRLLDVHLSITYNLQVGCWKYFHFPHFQLDNDRLVDFIIESLTISISKWITQSFVHQSIDISILSFDWTINQPRNHSISRLISQSVTHLIKLSINYSIDTSYGLTERSIIFACHNSTVEDQLWPELRPQSIGTPQNSDRLCFLLFFVGVWCSLEYQ